jgi:hypothetical protein
VKILCTVAVGLIVVPVALAQVPIKKYEQFKKDPSFKNYIDGVATGFLVANVELDRRKKPLLYCQPPNLAMNTEMYLSILDKKVKERESTVPADLPVELLLLEGLTEALPCGKPPRRR